MNIEKLLRDYQSINGRIINSKGNTLREHIDSKGYHRVTTNQGSILVHRMVYILSSGEAIPNGLCVDHIDRDKSNNKPDNLRLVTYSQNQMNRPVTTNKESGLPKNIEYNHGTGKHLKPYLGKIRVKGKRYTKTFYTVSEAAEWVKEKRRELHGEFYCD